MTYEKAHGQKSVGVSHGGTHAGCRRLQSGRRNILRRRVHGGDSSEQGSEKVTFTIAVGLNPLSKDEDFNNKEIFKLAEEATNVHIEWMPIAAADATDKVNIMLTSDLPDAFLGLIGTDQIASNMDSFADLAKDDLLKTYAPHIVEDYESSLSNGLDIVTWPDGSIRSLMTGPQTSYENDAEGIMFMNKEWLDKVGMDVPHHHRGIL